MRKKKIFKSFLALMLSLIMIVSGCIIAQSEFGIIKVQAEELPEKVDNVYQIKTADELMWFADHVNAGNTSVNAVLVNDIDMSGVNAWTPIGKTAELVYKGTFDGQTHRIKNLVINSTEDNQGLFGFIGGGARIYNVTIDKSCSIKSTGSNVGAIAAVALMNVNSSSVSIQYCGNEADVTGKTNVSGIIGIAKDFQSNNTLSMAYCYNGGKLTAESNSAGLVVLSASGVVQAYFFDSYSIGGTLVGNPGCARMFANCYTLNTTQSSPKGTSTIAYTEEELKSGALVVRMRYADDASTGSHVWKQTLGVDDYPNFTGQTVYHLVEYGVYSNGVTPFYFVDDYPAMQQGDVAYFSYVDMLNTGDVDSICFSSEEEVAEAVHYEYVGDDGNPVKCVKVTAKAEGETVITLMRGEYSGFIVVAVEAASSGDEGDSGSTDSGSTGS